MQSANRAKQCQTVPKQCQIRLCSHTPRFSYRCPKVTVSTPRCPQCRGCGQRVGTRDGYSGWVPGWVYRGEYYPPSTLLGERSHRQRSGPRKALRAWSGWSVGARANGRAGRSYPTPAGPGRSTPWPSLDMTSECPPWTNRARFDLISHKLSQNGRVSPK